jgi:hypothetical protein
MNTHPGLGASVGIINRQGRDALASSDVGQIRLEDGRIGLAKEVQCFLEHPLSRSQESLEASGEDPIYLGIPASQEVLPSPTQGAQLAVGGESENHAQENQYRGNRVQPTGDTAPKKPHQQGRRG